MKERSCHVIVVVVASANTAKHLLNSKWTMSWALAAIQSVLILLLGDKSIVCISSREKKCVVSLALMAQQENNVEPDMDPCDENQDH